VVLGKVIEILKTLNDNSLRIEGHTDNSPSWDLSRTLPEPTGAVAARRESRVPYLHHRQPIGPSLPPPSGESACGRHATLEGRAKTLAIEIVLVPKDLN